MAHLNHREYPGKEAERNNSWAKNIHSDQSKALEHNADIRKARQATDICMFIVYLSSQTALCGWAGRSDFIARSQDLCMMLHVWAEKFPSCE